MPQLYLALDGPNLEDSLRIGERVAPFVDGFKVGMALFFSSGISGYAAVARLGKPIFLDLKLHDIPWTVSCAIRNLLSVLSPRPQMITIHALGGSDMLRCAADAMGDVARGSLLLAVTLLTSLREVDARAAGMDDRVSILDHVLRLARMADDAGCQGVVLSAHEVQALKKELPHTVAVTPGISLLGGAGSTDQKRVATPAYAMQQGSDVIVIGRSVLGADCPEHTAAHIRDILDQSPHDERCLP